jgi:multiple sugar transport system ATP-binding protein
VASFIGSPPMNFIPAKLVSIGGRVYVDCDDFKLPLPEAHGANKFAGKDVTLGIRPEEIDDAALPTSVTPTEDNTITCKVDVLEPLGHEYVAYIGIGKHSLIATIDNETRIKEGQEARFAVNLDRMHIFDNETEEAIR